MFMNSDAVMTFRPSGATCLVRPDHLPVHCAPLERETVVNRQAYKHLAPSEPERPQFELVMWASLPA